MSAAAPDHFYKLTITGLHRHSSMETFNCFFVFFCVSLAAYLHVIRMRGWETHSNLPRKESYLFQSSWQCQVGVRWPWSPLALLWSSLVFKALRRVWAHYPSAFWILLHRDANQRNNRVYLTLIFPPACFTLHLIPLRLGE